MKAYSESRIEDLAIASLCTTTTRGHQTTLRPEMADEIPDQDDRYPGSFFRIPGSPVPGKTTWSLN